MDLLVRLACNVLTNIVTHKNNRTMKILQAITLSALLLLNISKVCSQEDKKTKDFFNSGGYISEGYALDRNQVRFNQSSDFVFHHIPNGNLICITSKQFRAHAFSRHYNCILSKDSNFIAYVSVPPIFCGDKDSIYADFSFKTGFMIEMNTYHLTHIKADFLKNTGKRVAFLSELPITYKSSKYARESFNADTVITYPLKMWEKYENKYTHCLVILIQKRYRGCIPLYCLYTDEGAKKLNHYIKSLKKVFWYRNPKDYIEVIDPVPETDNIFILPKRNESDTVRIVGQL